MTGVAPLTSRDSQQYRAVNVPELTQQVFDAWKAQNKNSSYFVEQTKRLSWSLGLASAPMVTSATLMMLVRWFWWPWPWSRYGSSYFVEWIPNNSKAGVCDISPKGLKMAVAFLGNTTAIQEMFKSVTEFSTWFGLSP